jgi:GWxTD domain-containing protein
MSRILSAFVPSLIAFLLTSCASYKIPKTLDPDSREFLSQVRYLISRDEHKVFLSLPGENERKAFIETFWQKRDPDPETEVNEFKMEYFKRIEEANLLFKEGTTPGWLCERGRLYITLGSPDTRETYPRGVTFYGIPTEIWYYGFFQVVFYDSNWSGYYQLAPESAAQIGELNKTQVMLRPQVSPDDPAGDFPIEIAKTNEGEATIRIRLPYKDIWFKTEGKSYEATIEFSAEAYDSAGKKVWQDEKRYPFSFNQDEYREILRDTLLIEMTIRLAPGEYSLELNLKNHTQGTSITKKEKLIL